ncbi:MAG: acyl-protein synthetase [Lachnospiraceae bacterium]|nr:acyl-protein synthetase [Lachnospiraceae bacterium]
MNYTRKLFKSKHIYELEKTDSLFVKAMRENCEFSYKNCADYKRILDEAGFRPEDIKSIEDLERLPFIPTLYFKHHELFSIPKKKMFIKATSSGTSGSMSKIVFDLKSLITGAFMVINVGRYHKLWSIKPTNYIIFGYRPTKTNQTAISKTAYGFTYFAPGVSRTFALEMSETGYKLDWERVTKALERYSKSKCPLRTMGFPAYTYFLLKDLKEKGISYKMPKGSMVCVGGGWKQFYTEQPDKHEFYNLVKEVLGIEEDHVVEFFGAVEHPILYTDCKCHHFHIPAYSRVIIRDPDTMKALPKGRVGLVNLLSPMLLGTPILSVMTDDLGVLHDEKCHCGAKSPWLEIIGRVGVSDVVTCAAGSEKYLRNEA